MSRKKEPKTPYKLTLEARDALAHVVNIITYRSQATAGERAMLTHLRVASKIVGEALRHHEKATARALRDAS